MNWVKIGDRILCAETGAEFYKGATHRLMYYSPGENIDTLLVESDKSEIDTLLEQLAELLGATTLVRQRRNHEEVL